MMIPFLIALHAYDVSLEEEVQRLQVELNHLKRVSMGKERHISRLEEEKLVMQKKIDQQYSDLEMLQQKGEE